MKQCTDPDREESRHESPLLFPRSLQHNDGSATGRNTNTAALPLKVELPTRYDYIVKPKSEKCPICYDASAPQFH